LSRPPLSCFSFLKHQTRPPSKPLRFLSLALSPLIRFALGVYDKKRGQLEVMPLEGQRLLRMEARVPGQQYDPRQAPSAFEADKRREHNKRCGGGCGEARQRGGGAGAGAGVGCSS
jgi:hypothetical protein